MKGPARGARRKESLYASSLRDVLGPALARTQAGRRVYELLAIDAWNRKVALEFQVATRAERVQDGVVFVVVDDAAWASQLTFFKRRLIRKLNTIVGETIVRDIRFQIGSVPREEYPSATVGNKPPWLDMPLDDDVVEEAKRQALEVPDPELRQAYLDLKLADSRRARWLRQQGWTPCRQCGVLKPPLEDVCPTCRREHEAGGPGAAPRVLGGRVGSQIREMAGILIECPSLTFAEAQETFAELTPTAFEEARRQAIEELQSLVHANMARGLEPGTSEHEILKRAVTAYIMMKTGTSPEAMNKDQLAGIVGKELASIL